MSTPPATRVWVTHKPQSFNSYSGNVVIPESVTDNGTTYTVVGIGSEAFKDCNKLNSVVLPNSITYINSEAFYNCSALTVIDIPNSVTKVEKKAFSGCSRLESVMIGNGVSEISEETFKNCYKLTDVTFGNAVTSIGIRAFYNCYKLPSIDIPNSVTSIGNESFSYCTGLTSVTIGNSVTSIASSAFYYCNQLREIDIPNSVTTIASNAFAECSGLKTLTIGGSVTSIGSSAFSGCTSLETLNFNAVSCASLLNMSPFEDTSISTVNVGDEVKSIPTSFMQSSLTLKSVKLGNSVTSIGASAFSGCPQLISINFPNSVITIGDWAFKNCSSLTSVSMPNSVTSIGKEAFSGCKGMNNLIISNSVTTINESSFRLCTGLTSVTIPNSVTSIGKNAFRLCSSLTSLTIGNSVKTISDEAFYGCSALTSVVIPNSVTTIGNLVFYECTALTEITLGSSIQSIGNSAFFRGPGLEIKAVNISSLESWCNIDFKIETSNPLYNSGSHLFLNGKEITDLRIPNSVTVIKPYAFCCNHAIVRLAIPSSVTLIDTMAFYDCKSLKIIDFNARNCAKISEGAFTFANPGDLMEKPLESISFGQGVEHIPANLRFFEMKKPLILPNSVKTIEKKAIFGRTPAVVIGGQIENIETDAFPVWTQYGGAFDAVSTVYATSPTPPPCSSEAFANPDTLYVPDGSKMKYFMADGWCEFKNIEVKDFHNNYVSPESITLNKSNFTMTKMSTMQLVATVTPSNTTEKQVKWSSSNEDIVKVSSSGLVTAIADGKAAITARLDDVVAVCHVTVSHLRVETLKLSPNRLQLELDDMATINAIITPDNAENQILEWDIPENNVIVTQLFNNTHSLNVGAVGEGSVTISASTTDGSNLKSYCVITVGDVEPGELGDVNGDHEVTIADLNAIINYILRGDYHPDYDLNNDGEVNIADANMLIDILINGY